jgi:phosphoribosylformimino-5-aminoimidazole carboxamide ribotide isomerase
VNGDPATLADVYRRLGVDGCYIADLDAIAGGAESDEAIRAIASRCPGLWVDAGITSPAQAERARRRGATHVIVGLETLPSFPALAAIVAAVGSDAVAFSLDLRDGRAMSGAATLAALSIDSLARRAADAGAGAIIVLDVARVGSGRGPDVPVIARVRQAVPGMTLLAGGGVRDASDLRQLAAAGCDGALLATALHGPNAAGLVRAGRSAVVHA